MRVPEIYPPMISSGRLANIAQELNDQYISITSGSEDYSFTVMRKNEYEEKLVKCEDERYKLDHDINVCDFEILKIEELAHKVNESISSKKELHFIFLHD